MLNVKKIILLITVLSLSTFVSAGFFSDDKNEGKIEENVVEQKYSKTEFHGLKAGMTKAEVTEYLELDKYLDIYKKENSYSSIATTDGLYKYGFKFDIINKLGHKDLSNKKFSNIKLSFTDDDILWKIQIIFNMPADVLSKIALGNVIRNNFPDANIEEKSSTESIGSFSYSVTSLYVIMSDKEITNSAINKLESMYEKKM